MSSRTNPGFTLLEVMVGSTLAAMVLGLFVAFLVPAMQYSGEASARAEVQQQAIIALNVMEADLRQTAASAVTLASYDPANPTAPVGYCCVPIQDVSPSGQQIWQTTVIESFWDKNRQSLMHKRWPPNPPGSVSVTLQTYAPTPLSLADFTTLATTPNNTEKPLASGVNNFTVAGGLPGPVVVPPISLDLTLERPAVSNKPPVRCHIQRTVAMRNSP